MVPNQSYVPLVEITRAQRVESVHRGAIAVVDAEGRLVASAGNPKEPVYVRSSAKPFQALALVCSGAADAYRVTPEELAVVCASHNGEPQHTRLVASLLRKAGLQPSDLLCGVHPPFDPATRRALLAAGEEPNILHNNCSGKHAGMLVAAKYLDLPTATYLDPEHEIQIAIRGLLAFLAGLDAEEAGIAIDGCSAPTFHLPLRSFALALARLAEAGEGLRSRHERGSDRGARGHVPDSESKHAGEYDLEDDALDGTDYADEARLGDRERNRRGEDDSYEDDSYDDDEHEDDEHERDGHDDGDDDDGDGDLDDADRIGDTQKAGARRGAREPDDRYDTFENDSPEEEAFPVSVPEALRRIWQAMRAHPVLVAGTRGRICTDLMRVAARFDVPLVAKSGAEGVYAIAVVHGNRALGIAVKIEDGAERARNAASLETLIQLGILPEEAARALAGYHRPPIRSHRADAVGEVHAAFRLNRGLPG